MLPPWKAYPKLNGNSLSWQMGPGEYYWLEFRGWYDRMAAEAREAFEREHGEPQDWNGFYARLKNGNVATARNRPS